MDALHDGFSRLGVREVQQSTTKCLLDRDARLISISGWSQCLTRGVVIALTIVDETDELEWTCMINSVPYRRSADEPFQVKIPSASIAHRFDVTAKVLNRISNSNGETADVDYYEVTSQSSCTAKTSSTRVAGISSLPVLDVRPHLRFNVGIKSGKDMLSILTAGSRLPTKKSKECTCTGVDSVELQIYQGDRRLVSHNRRVHSIELELQSEELKKPFTVTLDVAKDGTLTTIGKEQGYRNTNATVAPRIIDVICPKIAIDDTDPELQVEWKRTFGIVEKAILEIRTTYAEVDRWRVSVVATGVATGSGGHVFVFPRHEFIQLFIIPSDILTAGVRYEVTVEGLQKIDDSYMYTDSSRIVCWNSTTLKPIALPARTSSISSQMRTSRPLAQKSSAESAIGFQSKRSPTSHVDLNLRIEIERSTFDQASVIISTNLQAARAIRRWKISVKKIAKTTGSVLYGQAQQYDTPATGSRERFDFPLQFEAGSSYRVTVAPMEWSGGIYQNLDNSVEQTADFRAELTLEDIKALYSMAVQHAAGYGSAMCQWLYRNKSRQYFDDIELSHRGIMEVYDKDNSGDPASPINLQIKGLFFMASVERGSTRGEPIRVSPFGPLRVCIPAKELLAMAPNVYFVDFYCMRGQNHQVTLVMTRPGSKTDRFCAERLLPLDLTRNPFFFRDATQSQLRVSTRDQLLVELLFTEDLNISEYSLKQVPTVGKGCSTRGGIPKHPTCPLCNLRRRTAFQKF